MDTNTIHEVVYDYAGIAQLPRYTCTTCCETLLRHPYYDSATWHKTITRFLAAHPGHFTNLDAVYAKSLQKQRKKA